jgi:multidrug efflux pump subunit AcrA (membrane-fusion protein)
VNWYHDIGSHVKQGELLAVIDTPELNQQLSQARADLENARANAALAKITADRWTGLAKTRSVSLESVDQSVSNLSVLEATVNSYVANVRRLSISFRSKRSTPPLTALSQFAIRISAG